MKDSFNHSTPASADFSYINRAMAISLVEEFGDLYSLDVLRVHGNFRHMTFATAHHFDNFDLSVAIPFAIRHIKDDVHRDVDSDRKERLLKRLLDTVDYHEELSALDDNIVRPIVTSTVQ
jgi:hypothetical protein